MGMRAKLLVIAVALAAGSVAVAVPAGAQATPQLDPQQVAGSVAYLRLHYRVSEQEALRRLRLQATAEALAGTLAARVPRSYAGLWLDQDHGGRLVVAAKTPGDVTALLGGVADRSHVDVAKVDRSLVDLDAIRQRLATQLGDGPSSVLLPRISERTNQVVVWKRDWLVAGGVRPFAAADRSALDRAVAAAGGAVVVRSQPMPNQLTTKGDIGNQCFMLYCSPPVGGMRGGIRLEIPRDDGTVGGCTTGFNLRAHGGRYNGQPFVLTGGHCVNSPRHTHLDIARHEGTPVLREVPELAVNNFPYDYALLPYVDAPTARKWLERTPQHNLVLAWCRNGGLDSDADTPCKDGDRHGNGRVHVHGMTGASDVIDGFVVCATGAGSSSLDYTDAIDTGAGQGYKPGTRCGHVTGQSNGAIDTDLCARAGDSGGPLFSEVTNTGIGILEGNTQDRSGACQQGETNNYVPLSTIFGAVNGQPAAGGSTFKLITRERG